MRKVQSIQKLPYPAPDVVTKVVPVPTEGWDAISPLAAMDPKRAPILTNWVPRPGFIELRSGFTNWTYLGTSHPVESLMVYRAPTRTKMFAAMGGSIFDASIHDAYTVQQTGLSNARWQYINYTPAGASTVIQCVNGADSMRMYDGSTWSTPTVTGLPFGLSTAAIRNIASGKRRIWYILGDGSGQASSVAAFMPVDAIMGPIAGYIDFGALWNKGGGVVAMGNWTVDGGSGPQDYAVFISSMGQVSVFAGTDPANAVAWSLVGTFDLSPPIGLRCMTRVGSDIGIITQDGVLPISQALPFDPSADRSVAITARIQNAMANVATLYKDNFGWQFITFPAQQLAILNVPTITNQQQIQYVMNSITGAWCNFSGWNANCFEVFADEFYFGGNDGAVYKAWHGGLDLNQPISADVQCAYNYFDDPGRLKRMTMVQPLMVATGTVTPSIGVDEDFSVSTTTSPIQFLVAGATWDDTGVWDVSIWPPDQGVRNPWLSVEAIGHALAIHMTVNIASSTTSTITSQFDIGVFDTAEFDQGGVSTNSGALQLNAFNAIMELGGFV